MNKKHFLLLFTLICLGVGNVWGTDISFSWRGETAAVGSSYYLLNKGTSMLLGNNDASIDVPANYATPDATKYLWAIVNANKDGHYEFTCNSKYLYINRTSENKTLSNSLFTATSSSNSGRNDDNYNFLLTTISDGHYEIYADQFRYYNGTMGIGKKYDNVRFSTTAAGVPTPQISTGVNDYCKWAFISADQYTYRPLLTELHNTWDDYADASFTNDTVSALNTALANANTELAATPAVGANIKTKYEALLTAISAYNTMVSNYQSALEDAVEEANELIEIGTEGISDYRDAIDDAEAVAGSTTTATAYYNAKATLATATATFLAANRPAAVTSLANAIANARAFTPAFTFLTDAADEAEDEKDDEGNDALDLIATKNTLNGVIADAIELCKSEEYTTYCDSIDAANAIKNQVNSSINGALNTALSTAATNLLAADDTDDIAAILTTTLTPALATYRACFVAYNAALDIYDKSSYDPSAASYKNTTLANCTTAVQIISSMQAHMRTANPNLGESWDVTFILEDPTNKDSWSNPDGERSYSDGGVKVNKTGYFEKNDWILYQDRSVNVGAYTLNADIVCGGFLSGPKVNLAAYDKTSQEVGESFTATSVSFSLDATKTISIGIRTANGGVGNATIKNVTLTKIHQTTTYTVTTNSEGWATFCSPYKTTIPEGLVVYTGVYNGSRSLLELTPNEGATVVPEEEGILLKGTANTAYTITETSDVASTLEENDLHGTILPTTRDESCMTFILSSRDNSGNSVPSAFYKYLGATIPANKAYLTINGEGSAFVSIRVMDSPNETTPIENIQTEEKAVKFFENGRLLILRDGKVYDTAGRLIR